MNEAPNIREDDAERYFAECLALRAEVATLRRQLETAEKAGAERDAAVAGALGLAKRIEDAIRALLEEPKNG